ncbi:hypothetical protein IFM89_003353 [Coptis chinensis]|uniref:Uncharacterized protein n=1 Tax=Coptis chinensis TaxID=261450 RepID=A0A835IXW2_9MAGN|nr:hypothetical protein IFM89_003353 [Coptis chinensis]
MKISNRLMLIFEASEHVIDLINQGNYGVIHQQKSIPIFQTAMGKLVEELKSSMMKALSVLNGNDDHVAHTGPEPRECLPCRKPFDSSPGNTQTQGLRDSEGYATQTASVPGVNFVIMNEDVLLEEAHSHQLHPISYCKDLVEVLGEILEHDDTDSDRTKGQKLDTGFSGTTMQWENTFGSRFAAVQLHLLLLIEANIFRPQITRPAAVLPSVAKKQTSFVLGVV